MKPTWHLYTPEGWKSKENPEQEQAIRKLMDLTREAMREAEDLLPLGTKIELVDEDEILYIEDLEK